MIFAQVLHGIVVNTIVIASTPTAPGFLKDQHGKKYDCVVRIDNMKPRPGMGWLADCRGHFKQPNEEVKGK